MDDKYIAHFSENKERIQSIKEHADGVALLAEQFADAFGYGEWGFCAGILHDIGKYSTAFQRRIQGENIRVDHSTAGAQVCWEKGGLYLGLSYCIAGHHAGLPDTGEKSDSSESATMYGRQKRKVEDFRAYMKEMEIPVLTKMPFLSMVKEKNTFVLGLFIRMIFSCLVDADFLDTENFMNGESVRDPGESMEVLCGKLHSVTENWIHNDNLETINGRRSHILRSCLEKSKNTRGIFRLTVPTGGGKTIASLAFALEHAREHHMDRIIYVIPYTSIIEQNAGVFRDILGERNVLENHCNVEYDGGEEFHPMQLAAENWDKPVVVTTNVQFFESFFSNKSSKCRKLHNVANSVVVFDEVQMLPNDYLKPCVEIMEELVRYYRSSVVLCTATQPALKTIFSNDILATELCPSPEEQFLFFKRVSLKNKGMLTLEELTGMLTAEKQVLCILNTKKMAARVFREVREKIKDMPTGKNVYHLSTSLYPKHRKRVLEQVRKHLLEKEPCIVIATSLIEAGVDLDFQTVYRQLAGVDSMIQAAGRCNREGNRKPDESFTYIFQLEDSGRVPGQEQQIAVAKQVIRDQEDISSLEAIQEYFELLYHYRGDSLDRKNILGQFHKNRFPFAKVNDEFRMMEEGTRAVFIPREDSAGKLLDELNWSGITKSWIRKAGQYCVNIYERDFNILYRAGVLSVLSDKVKSDIMLLNNMDYYLDDTGLVLETEKGMALFS
ncbi:MAG: CRISPR-associated helicase Cas3' [Clostridiales bacterium]|nr:CRISPR-associated helicase Cas3' [Clostridiales bacterium]